MTLYNLDVKNCVSFASDGARNVIQMDKYKLFFLNYLLKVPVPI